MTTILADAKLGVMVADSSISNDDRVWSGMKVWRVRDCLVGMAGEDPHRMAFLDWYRAGMAGAVEMGAASALILTPRGLFFMDANYTAPQRV